jgi:hypothetical protein
VTNDSSQAAPADANRQQEQGAGASSLEQDRDEYENDNRFHSACLSLGRVLRPGSSITRGETKKKQRPGTRADDLIGMRRTGDFGGKRGLAFGSSANCRGAINRAAQHRSAA